MAIISYSRKLIFIHIPKCGGTSIETEWQRHKEAADMVISHNMAATKKYHFGQHASFQDIAELVGNENITTFETCALIREPLRVVESYYKYGHAMLKRISAAVATSHDAGELERAASYVRQNIDDMDEKLVPRWIYVLNRGVGRDAIVASSFDEFLERTLDDRWSRYLRSYTNDKLDIVAVKTILKLEDPIAIKKYFRSRTDRRFSLVHSNGSLAAADVFWTPQNRRKFYDIAREEYELFGYAPSVSR